MAIEQTSTEQTSTEQTSTEQTSTDPLRATAPHLTEPSRPATAHTANGSLHVPGGDAVADPNNSTTADNAAADPSNVHNPLNARYPHTQIAYDDPDFTRPPPLKYSLRTRKKAIFWFWTLIILDCVFMPIGLYFGMWYGLTRDQLSANATFSISTALLGTVSIVEYFIRFHRLWKKNSNCRVIGAKRAYLDWFHWNLSFAWFFIMIELIAGTCPHDPPIRVLAMPAPTMLFAIGFQLLFLDILRLRGVPAPCRISSLPKGAPLRPGVYAYVEDICAVDGSGGTEFRQRLNLRYQASKAFREMLHRQTLFWAIGAIVCATATTAIIFTIQRDAAYVVGWILPFLWAGIWAAITIPWVQRDLKKEYDDWTEARWKA